VAVPAQERKGVLAAECGDPEIVGGDGLALLFQFKPEDRVGASGLIVHIEHRDGRNPFSEPALITCPVTGLCDSKTVFTEDNHGYGEVFGAGNDFEGGRFVVGSGR